MKPEIDNDVTQESEPQQQAVSLYGQTGGAGDFPVLKAFQEYIDAEQTKARKRMIALSAFFIIILFIIVLTFTLIMSSFIMRNQALSDKLLDIALREKAQPQPVVNVQQPLPQPVAVPQQSTAESALKPLLEQMGKLAEAIAKRQEQLENQPKPVPAAVSASAPQLSPAQSQTVVTVDPAPITTVPMPLVESSETIRLKAELKRQEEALKAENELLKEAIHQAEIERHRRRLYPEYYAKEEAKKFEGTTTPKSEKGTSPLPDKSIAPTPKIQPKTKPVTSPSQAMRPQRKNPPSPPAPPSTSTPASVDTVKPGPAKTISKDVPTALSVEQAAVGSPSSVARPSKAIDYFADAKEDDPELKALLTQTLNAKKKQPSEAKGEPSPPAVTPNPAPQKATPLPPAPTTKASQTSSPASKPQKQSPEKKTVTLTIGSSDTNAIPWLIEESPESK